MTMTDANGPSWMGSESILLVCTRCNRTNSDEERNGVRGGAVLLDAIRARPPDPSVRIQPIACVSACKRACAIGLMAPGKVGYLFGDLPPDASAAEAIGELASPRFMRPSRTASCPVSRVRRSCKPASSRVCRPSHGRAATRSSGRPDTNHRHRTASCYSK
jgi:predicted metal-binding protein